MPIRSSISRLNSIAMVDIILETRLDKILLLLLQALITQWKGDLKSVLLNTSLGVVESAVVLVLVFVALLEQTSSESTMSKEDIVNIKRQYVNPRLKASFTGKSDFQKNAKQKYKSNIIDKAFERILAYYLHKPVVGMFKRRRVWIPGIGDQYMLDLLDLSKYAPQNNGYKWLLTGIDGFSKVANVVKIKDKRAETVLKAFKLLLKKFKNKPNYCQFDEGKEFVNRQFLDYMQEQNIKRITTGSNLKAFLIERWHRTLMTTISRWMTHNDSTKYTKVLDDIVRNYNNSYHRSIKMDPSQVNEKNEVDVYFSLYGNDDRGLKNPPKPKFNIGDCSSELKEASLCQRLCLYVLSGSFYNS
ncbi:unnamed protein product [Allacma fusca]|uniref:Integrase catalytic domain-containing protein n=1 Tax=Allacma fusca TaxID=39272 RepID=A0A8J2KBK2_9HEXA|nr:unnamed protein product [Allacma fusca]